MRIDLAPFRGAPHGGLDETFVFTVPTGRTPLGDLWRLARPAEVLAVVVGGPREVRVQVRSELDLRAPCDRCLEDVLVRLTVAYAEEWRLDRPQARGRPEESLDADDASLVRRQARGEIEDLDDGFWQNVSLELPVKVLCAQACRGLCPRCGANRNRTPCTCREGGTDPRLAALAAWRPDRRP